MTNDAKPQTPTSFDRVLIDADSMAYRAALAHGPTMMQGFDDDDPALELKGDPSAAFAAFTESYRWLLDTFVSSYHGISYSDFRLCFTGPNNYRKNIPGTKYKAQRGPSPEVLKPLRQRIETELAHVVFVDPRLEADDLLGLNKYRGDGLTLIVSEDKDLLQLPGWSLNPRHPEDLPRFTTEPEGYGFLLRQLITGDPADNVKGLWRLGASAAHGMVNDSYLGLSLSTILMTAEQQQRRWPEKDINVERDLQLLYILRGDDSPDDLITIDRLKERFDQL